MSRCYRSHISQHQPKSQICARCRGEYPGTPTRVAKLIKKQKGICTHCGFYFTSEDLLEVDHITPKSQGGKDTYDNLQLLHRHCHDTKTAQMAHYHQSLESYL